MPWSRYSNFKNNKICYSKPRRCFFFIPDYLCISKALESNMGSIIQLRQDRRRWWVLSSSRLVKWHETTICFPCNICTKVICRVHYNANPNLCGSLPRKVDLQWEPRCWLTGLGFVVQSNNLRLVSPDNMLILIHALSCEASITTV